MLATLTFPVAWQCRILRAFSVSSWWGKDRQSLWGQWLHNLPPPPLPAVWCQTASSSSASKTEVIFIRQRVSHVALFPYFRPAFHCIQQERLRTGSDGKLNRRLGMGLSLPSLQLTSRKTPQSDLTTEKEPVRVNADHINIPTVMMYLRV